MKKIKLKIKKDNINKNKTIIIHNNNEDIKKTIIMKK
jgi:hypothetical protein